MKIPLSVYKVIGNKGALLQKASPDIMFAVGLGAVVAGSIILYRRATTKYYGHTLTKQEEAKLLVKQYATPVALEVGGLMLMTGGYVIQKKRVAAIAAAAVLTEELFRKYKEQVDKVLTDEQKTALATDYDKEAESVTELSIENSASFERFGYSPYCRLFQQGNANWQPVASYNEMFLRCEQNYFNDLLKARGHVFLNEVYDRLGLERSKAGAVVGWSLKSDPDGEPGDGYITIGYDDFRHSNRRLFMSGESPNVMLDFNVDGIIIDYI